RRGGRPREGAVALGADRRRDLRRARRLHRSRRALQLLPAGGDARRGGDPVRRRGPRRRARPLRRLPPPHHRRRGHGGGGGQSRRAAEMAGVVLPVDPVRRHLLMSGPCDALPRMIPMTIDADTGVLIRREGERILIAYSNPDEPAGFDATFDPGFAERIAGPLEERFPAVSDAGLDRRRSWAGLYEVTPDHHAVVGAAPGIPGFFLANGFSGHGVMHSPAAGRAI